MGTSTVTQDREPQKVGETLQALGEKSTKTKKKLKPRSCVKTQMMQRDCEKNQKSVSSLFSGKSN